MHCNSLVAIPSVWLVLASLALNNSAKAQGVRNDTEAQSEYATQLEYQRQVDRIDKLIQELSNIAALAVSLSQIVSQADGLSFDPSALSTAIGDAAQALDTLASFPDEKEISRNTEEVQKYFQAVGRIRSQLFAPYLGFREQIENLRRKYEDDPGMQSVLRVVLRPSPQPSTQEIQLTGSNELAPLSNVSDQFRFLGEGLIVGKIRKSIESAQTYLKSLAARSSQIFSENKSVIKAHLTQMQGALGVTQKQNEDELTSKRNLQKQLDTKLQQAKERQEVLDSRLSIAIWLMIGALILLFMALRVFPGETVRTLIESRTLVEMISMAFMLLTIIILGTGAKLGTEALGTLLGTIAGYIFG